MMRKLDIDLIPYIEKEMGLREGSIQQRTRMGHIVQARYIVACIWDYQLGFRGKSRIAEELPIKRSNLYNGWKSLMSMYLYNKWERDFLDEIFLINTGKTFLECESEAYKNLEKAGGNRYYKKGDELKSMQKREKSREEFERMLNLIINK